MVNNLHNLIRICLVILGISTSTCTPEIVSSEAFTSVDNNASKSKEICRHDIILNNHPLLINPNKITPNGQYNELKDGLLYQLRISDCFGNLNFKVYRDSILLEEGEYVGLGDTLRKYRQSLNPETYLEEIQIYERFKAFLLKSIGLDTKTGKYREQISTIKVLPSTSTKFEK